MLEALQGLHREIVDGLDELERLAASAEPDRAAVAAARLRLSRASGKRRRLLALTLYPALDRLGMAAGPRLRALREADVGLLTQSTRHVAEWTVDRVLAQWPDYQRVSCALRAAMRRRIAEERLVLYPLLQRADLSSSAATPS